MKNSEKISQMKTYISILRGVNVSGHNLIKMDALRKSYESMGFHKVSTYVQSGNVLFEGDDIETGELEQKIFRQIEKDFGFEIPVIVLTIDRLKRVINNNPFLKDPDKEPAYFHVTLLSSKPEFCGRQLIEDKKQDGEEIAFSDDAVYLYCPNGYGKTKLTNNLLEAKLKVGATTRNWRTVNELLRICKDG